MSGSGRWIVFSLTACMAYTVAYYFDWPFFRYYLASGSFSFRVEPETAGAPILWYGWLVTAALIGLFATAIPRAATFRMPPDALWVVPAAATLAAVLYEVRWFL